jgi:hypothetical protein
VCRVYSNFISEFILKPWDRAMEIGKIPKTDKGVLRDLKDTNIILEEDETSHRKYEQI